MSTAVSSDHAQRVCDELPAAGVDVLLISTLTNVRYVTGFTGSSAMALLGAAPDGIRRFFSDFRYETQSAAEVDSSFAREIVSGELLPAVGAALEQAGAPGRLGFDDAATSVRQHAALAEALPDGWELVGAGGLIERVRQVKDAAELAKIAAAASLIDDLMAWLCEYGLAGRTEVAVAVELEHQMRLRGAQAASFPSIVASGERGAMPHADPRDEKIAHGVLVTVDMGARLDGYCSDCTRTFATGPLVDEEARTVYRLVLRAQCNAVDQIRAGMTTREVDALARSVIADAGYGERFGHNLGHGVGLDVHESPRLSPTFAESTLVAGNVVTIEPGIYLPGRFGVRIEDLVVVTEDGCEIYSTFTKDLLTID